MSPDVIVIGAGVAGLAAATALTAAGARVLVVEARGVLGGRATSFVDRTTGMRLDNGQHVVLGCYRQTFAFLDRIGARDGILLQPSLRVPMVDRHGVASELRCPDWPSPFHLLAGVLGWDALRWRDRLAILGLASRLRQARAVAAGRGSLPEELHVLTVAEWLRRAGQTPRLCELLWEPLAVAALNQHIDVSSAAPFVRILGDIFGPHRRDAAIGLPIRPLGDIFGDAARRYLEERGSEVRLHAPARLMLRGRTLEGVRTRDAVCRAASVVVAVPWAAWRTLLSDQEARDAGLADIRDAALARRSSPIVTVNLWTDRPVVNEPFLGLPGRVFQWMFQRASSETGGCHLSMVSSGADAVACEPEETLVTRAWQDVSEAVPAARSAVVRHASVVRERQATFSLAPGQPPRPPTRTALAGLCLAGDWTDTSLPATIEGAVRSGHAAAAGIRG